MKRLPKVHIKCFWHEHFVDVVMDIYWENVICDFLLFCVCGEISSLQ